MTKADLARAIYDRHGGLTVHESLYIIDLIFNTIKQQLLAGNRVQITGFGTLEIVRRKRRRGRNPVTGEDIELPDRKALVFRPAQAIKSV